MKLRMQFLQREKVGGNVFANGGVWTATGLDRPDAIGAECLVPRQEFAVFLREDVVRDRGDVHPVAQLEAELKHQRSLAAAHRAADADRERAPREVAVERQI